MKTIERTQDGVVAFMGRTLIVDSEYNYICYDGDGSINVHTEFPEADDSAPYFLQDFGHQVLAESISGNIYTIAPGFEDWENSLHRIITTKDKAEPSLALMQAENKELKEEVEMYKQLILKLYEATQF